MKLITWAWHTLDFLEIPSKTALTFWEELAGIDYLHIRVNEGGELSRIF